MLTGTNRWPVIVGIVIGSLVLLSVLYCFARCLCCGAECACCCFKCCAGCCGSGRNKKHKQLESGPNTPYNGGPGGGPGPGMPMYNNQYQAAPQPVYHNPYSQTATFESAKVHEDSLPAMPSWENASSRKVEIIEDQKTESHELEKLNAVGRAETPPSPTLPGFAAPQPVRPNGSLPHSPYAENDSFLGAYNAQTNGVTHADSHSGYRGASPNPGQLGNPGQIGYGYANRQPGGFQSSQNVIASRDFQSQSTIPPSYGQGTSHPNYGQSQGTIPPNYQSQSTIPPNYGQSSGVIPSRPAYNNNDRQYSDNSRQQNYDNRQQYSDAQPYDRNNHQVSPVYSGSTAYDHDQRGPSGAAGYQAYRSPTSPAYGNGPPGQQGRKPVGGSWKEV